MANTLGTASLVLATDGQPLQQGLGKAKGDITSFSTSAKTKLAGGIGSAFKGIGGAISGGLKAALTGGVMGVAGAITGKLTETLSSPFERIGDIAAQGNVAQAFGLPVEKFTALAGIAKSAGVDTKDFTEILAHLGKTATDVFQGTNEEAVKTFGNLKINAAQFKAMDPADQFYKLFDSLSNLKSPAERVQALMTGLGEEGGKKLIPLMSKSSEELRSLGEQYKLSAEQVAKAQLASESFTEAQAKIQRVFDEIVVALAPFIEQIGNGISAALGNSGQNFSKFGNTALTVIKYVAKATAALMDVWTKASQAADVFVGQGAALIGDAIGDKDLAAGGREVRDKGWNDLVNKPFAQNQAVVDKFFADFNANLVNSDKLQKRIDKLNNPGQIGQNTAATMTPVAAAMKGSQEAAAIAARFDMEGQRTENIQKQQLQAQKNIAAGIGQVVDVLQSLPILNVL